MVVGLGVMVIAMCAGEVRAQATKSAAATLETSPYVRVTPRAPPLTELQIAVWNLQHLTKEEAAALKKKQSPKRTIWRNTFGAERKTATWRSRGRTGIDANVVALQGVTNVNDMRRMFSARTHHVVVSRAALSDYGAAINTSQRQGTEAPGFSAIAIRRKAGLRLSGQRHFVPPRLGRTIAQWRTPGFAIRLRIGAGKYVWVAILRLTPECQIRSDRAPLPQCDGERLATEDINRWIADTLAKGNQIVLAGTGVSELGSRGQRVFSKPSKFNIEYCAHRRPGIDVLSPSPGTLQLTNLSITSLAAPEPRPCALKATLKID